MRWVEVFRSGALERAGAKVNTTRQLAAALSEELKETVTVDALFNAHKRHRERLNLRGSLMEYMAGDRSTAKPTNPNDIRFPISDERRRALSKAKRFVITSALNNCPLHAATWESLQVYAKANDAELVVLPIRYVNPTSRIDARIIDTGVFWPSEVEPLLVDELVELHEHLWLMGHVRVQATAVTPLSGLEALSRGASGIFGHGQLSMKMIPTPQHRLPKVMYTTGSVSEARYSDTRAGVKGDFHHGRGGLVVELDGPRFHVRALVADDDGGFYDIDRYYSRSGVEKSTGALAIVTGDEHAMFADPQCKQATYTGKDSIVAVTKPERIVRHDVFDGYSISHHNRKDPITQIAKHRSGACSVESELQITVDHIDETTPAGAKNLIVSSNHNEHLLRWLKETTPLDEPWNADTWHELWGLLRSSICMGDNGAECADPLALWSADRLKSDTEFLAPDSDATIGGILIGLHGDKGSNGARGSIRQFSRIGIKTIVGHSHTPGIHHGCYQVGTSSRLKLEYNSGPSSWAHCHCLIHPNGKRQLIFVIDGHWRSARKKGRR